jgi:hypothetical protein
MKTAFKNYFESQYWASPSERPRCLKPEAGWKTEQRAGEKRVANLFFH